MSAVASVVFFAVAMILNLAGISHGHVDHRSDAVGVATRTGA